MDKGIVSIHNEILFIHKKGSNLAICDNVDGVWVHYAMWNKSKKDKYCMISLICGI